MQPSLFYERLISIINTLNISQNKFEIQVGLTKGTLKNIANGGSPGLENIQKILSTYKEVSAEWLLRGTGYMFKEDQSIMIASEPAVEYRNREVPLVITVDSQGKENILMVNSKAYAGYTSNITEPEYLGSLPAFGMPLPEFRNSTLRAFQASGQSMEPSIYNGDWLIAQYIDNWPKNIKEGYIHIIVTQETILVKRILNRLSDGKLIILSDNEAYPTDFIYPEDVKELWYLKAKISFQFPNTRFEVLREISNLKADVELLKRQISKA